MSHKIYQTEIQRDFVEFQFYIFYDSYCIVSSNIYLHDLKMAQNSGRNMSSA